MQYTRVYTGDDGRSHFEDTAIEMQGEGPWMSRSIHADRISFTRMPAGTFGDWHCAPRRQFVITLVGSARIVCEGEERSVEPGTAMLLDDTTGKGHQTVVGKAEDRVAMIVSLTVEGERPAGGDRPAQPATQQLILPRVVETPDGGTSFDQVAIELAGKGPWSSRPEPAGRIIFLRMSAGQFADWHVEPRRQWVITLAGSADIVTTDNDKRKVQGGSAMLFEDVTGKGHQTVVSPTEERHSMIVSLGE